MNIKLVIAGSLLDAFCSAHGYDVLSYQYWVFFGFFIVAYFLGVLET